MSWPPDVAEDVRVFVEPGTAESEREAILVDLVGTEVRPGPLHRPVPSRKWNAHKARINDTFHCEVDSDRDRQALVGGSLIIAWINALHDMNRMPAKTADVMMRFLLGERYRQAEAKRQPDGSVYFPPGHWIETALPIIVTTEDADGERVEGICPDILGRLWPSSAHARAADPEVAERGRRLEEYLGRDDADLIRRHHDTYRNTEARKELARYEGLTVDALRGRVQRAKAKARRVKL